MQKNVLPEQYKYFRMGLVRMRGNIGISFKLRLKLADSDPLTPK